METAFAKTRFFFAKNVLKLLNYLSFLIQIKQVRAGLVFLFNDAGNLQSQEIPP